MDFRGGWDQVTLLPFGEQTVKTSESAISSHILFSKNVRTFFPKTVKFVLFALLSPLPSRNRHFSLRFSPFLTPPHPQSGYLTVWRAAAGMEFADEVGGTFDKTLHESMTNAKLGFNLLHIL